MCTSYNCTETTFEYGSDGQRYKQTTGNTTTYYVDGGKFEKKVTVTASKTRQYLND